MSVPAGGPQRAEDLTQVAQDYLKVIWSATEWGGPPITATALATRFGTTQANVTETVKRLASQDLVDYRRYQPVTLTARGAALALTMVRRHRLVECFLVTTLGYDGDEVHDEAERLEHAVSDTLITRIDLLLGHPSTDPHGDPIPAPDGTVVRPAGTLGLSEAQPGRYRVVRISDAESGALGRLLAGGVGPDAVVTVHTADTVHTVHTVHTAHTVHTGDTDVPDGGRARAVGPRGIALSEADCGLIRVQPITG